MKVCLHLLLITLFISCGTKKEETNVADATSEIVEERVETKVENASSLPVLNFSEFESAYLKPKENDTTYVLNFWATWCKPCIQELPYFEKLNAEKENVKVVLVSLDFPNHIEKQVLPFIKKYNLKSEILLLDEANGNKWIPKVSPDWSGAIPATVILKNKEMKFFEQSFTYIELEKAVQSI